jgi:hypothetical protein
MIGTRNRYRNHRSRFKHSNHCRRSGSLTSVGATTVVEHALQRLREECESKGKLWLFQALSSHLTDERDEVSYAKLSSELGMAETAVKKQLHNMRQRYRSLLRDEVSQTVEDPADADDEIRYLCASLATGTEYLR